MGRRKSTLQDANLVTIEDVDSKYDVIKVVADNIEQIVKLEEGLDITLKYLGSSNTLPTSRLDGTNIKDGDYFFNTDLYLISYYDEEDSAWFDVSPEDILSAAVSSKESEQRSLDSKISASASAEIAEEAEHKASASEAVAAQAAVESLANKSLAVTSAEGAKASEISAKNYSDKAEEFKDSASTSKQEAETYNSSAAAHAETTQRNLESIKEIYDSFDDRYLGVFDAEPVKDNDGDDIIVGAIYFDSVLNHTKYYNGASWENPERTVTEAALSASQSAQSAATNASAAQGYAESASSSSVKTEQDRVLVESYTEVAQVSAEDAQNSSQEASSYAESADSSNNNAQAAAEVSLASKEQAVAAYYSTEDNLIETQNSTEQALEYKEAAQVASESAESNAESSLQSSQEAQQSAQAASASKDVSQTASEEVLQYKESVESSEEYVKQTKTYIETLASQAQSNADNAASAKSSAAGSAAYAEYYKNLAEQYAQAASGSLKFVGDFNASEGSYPDSPSTGSVFYKVSVAGVVDGLEYAVGDSIVYDPNNSSWFKLDNTEQVTSVNGKVGAVILSSSDVGALASNSGNSKVQPLETTHGSLSISGVNGSYSGINFSDVDRTLMVNTVHTGIYNSLDSKWVWAFGASGELVVGSVPFSKVTGNITFNGNATANDGSFVTEKAQNTNVSFSDAHIKARPVNGTTNFTGATTLALGVSVVENYGYTINALRTAGNAASGSLDVRYHAASDSGVSHLTLDDSGLKLKVGELYVGDSKVYHEGSKQNRLNTVDDTYDYMSASIHMQDNDIRSLNELHFDSGARFTSNSSNWLDFTMQTNGSGGIRLLDGSSNLRGYIYSDSAGYTGVLNDDNKWSFRGHKDSSELWAGNTSKLLVSSSNNHEIVGNLTSKTRNGGIFGAYDSYKIDHVWGMGINYKIDSDGADFGSLYGLAYKHTNNATGGTMAGGHQLVVCQNGVPGVALGMNGNIWATGLIHAKGYLRVGDDTGELGGNRTIAIPDVDKFIEIANPTSNSYLYPSGCGLVMHNRGVSTSGVSYVNTSADVGAFHFKSDDTSWDVRINDHKVYHEGFKQNRINYYSSAYDYVGADLNLQNHALHYTKEVHFQSGMRFVNSSSSVLHLKSGVSTSAHLELRNSDNLLMGAFHANSDSVGLLDDSGRWAFRHVNNTRNELIVNNVVKATVHNAGMDVVGDLTENGQRVLTAVTPQVNGVGALPARTGSFKVGGDVDTWYPVVISGDRQRGEMYIYRSNVHTDFSWAGAGHLKINSVNSGNGHLPVVISYECAVSRAHIFSSIGLNSQSSNIVVYLRGGRTYYYTGTDGRYVSNSNPSGTNVQTDATTWSPTTTAGSVVASGGSPQSTAVEYKSKTYIGNALEVKSSIKTPSLSSTSVDADVVKANKYFRNSHSTGHLVGSYNNVGANHAATNPIYTIGDNYKPADSALGDMYGIGYTTGSASFIPFGTTGWGMYLASGGTARIFLDSTSGDIFTKGDYYSESGKGIKHNNNGKYRYIPYVTGGIGTRSEMVSGANILLHADTDGTGTSEFMSIRAGAGTANELKLVSKSSSDSVSNSSLTLNGYKVWNEGNDSDLAKLSSNQTWAGNHTFNKLTGGSSVVIKSSTANNWSYLRLHTSSKLWDVAMKDNDLDGSLQFRYAGSDTNRVTISTAGHVSAPRFICNTTNIGKDTTSLVTYVSGEWGKHIGYSRMIRSASSGFPSSMSYYGYWNVTGKRDSANGYVGMLYPHIDQHIKFGRSELGTANPIWRTLPFLELANTWTGANTFKAITKFDESVDIAQDRVLNFQPNSTWGGQLRVGGNGWSRPHALASCITSTNANLHLDAGTSGKTYLNFYSGTAGVSIHAGTSTALLFINNTEIAASRVISANAGLKQGGHTILNGTDTWLRTKGDAGWYSATYGGGVYMIDTIWVKVYGNKRFHVSNTEQSSIYTNGGIGFDNALYDNNATGEGGLVGNYNGYYTADKIIWTIGKSWQTHATHFGLGYHHGNEVAGGDKQHQIVIKSNGVTYTRFGMDGGISTTGLIHSDTLFTLGNTSLTAKSDGIIMDSGTSTTLTLKSDDGGASKLELHGDGQGTGSVYVGQSSEYGGGIEYNGDNNPVTTGAGADYIALYKRAAGNDSWTARNHYSNNNWEFRGDLSAGGSVEVGDELSVDASKIKHTNGRVLISAAKGRNSASYPNEFIYSASGGETGNAYNSDDSYIPLQYKFIYSSTIRVIGTISGNEFSQSLFYFPSSIASRINHKQVGIVSGKIYPDGYEIFNTPGVSVNTLGLVSYLFGGSNRAYDYSSIDFVIHLDT